MDVQGGLLISPAIVTQLVTQCSAYHQEKTAETGSPCFSLISGPVTVRECGDLLSLLTPLAVTPVLAGQHASSDRVTGVTGRTEPLGSDAADVISPQLEAARAEFRQWEATAPQDRLRGLRAVRTLRQPAGSGGA